MKFVFAKKFMYLLELAKYITDPFFLVINGNRQEIYTIYESEVSLDKEFVEGVHKVFRSKREFCM